MISARPSTEQLAAARAAWNASHTPGEVAINEHGFGVCRGACVICRPMVQCDCGAQIGEPCKQNGWTQVGPVHPARASWLSTHYKASP